MIEHCDKRVEDVEDSSTIDSRSPDAYTLMFQHSRAKTGPPLEPVQDLPFRNTEAQRRILGRLLDLLYSATKTYETDLATNSAKPHTAPI